MIRCSTVGTGCSKDMRPFNPPHTIRAVLLGLAVGLSVHFPVLAASGPPLRTGLWVTQKISEAAADPSAFEATIRGNPKLSGVCLSVGWREIENEAGKPDFSSIDKAVAVLRRIGMKYELGIKPGVDTPPFVYQKGAQSFETQIRNPHRPNFGAAVTIPVPWDPKYQENFSRIIAQLGERYSSDPLCVSVVLTCANFMSKEMHLPKDPEDRGKWSTMGDYGPKLLSVYKKYTDEWAKAFPRQQVTLHLSQVLNLPPSFFDSVIDYGLSKYPERFTIQNCQLTGRKEDTGRLSYDLIQKYQDRAHRGFQSVAGFSRGGERMGSIEMAVLNVVHGNGEYWELWHGDGMNPQTSAAIESAWQEGKKLGYEAYKEKLVSEGRYQEQEGRGHRGKRGRGRRSAEPFPTE
jgi:glycosyl hydrolase family 42 (putative beta-galactosidase)